MKNILGLILILPLIVLQQANVITQDTTDLNEKWREARNSEDSSIVEFYMPNAIKVVTADSICNNASEVTAYHKAQNKVSSIHSLFRTEVNPYRGITYEILTYETEQHEAITQLVIYEKGTEHPLRAFEYEAIQANQGQVDTIAITRRRVQWMGHCNAHEVPELVFDLYGHNTLYYNHRPLVKGRQALVREYAYMNNEQYSLVLNPLIVEVVNESTVFEIGQCQGSYDGKYILIWKKEEDGQWRIFIDSNV